MNEAGRGFTRRDPWRRHATDDVKAQPMPRLWWKLLWTTVAAGIIFAIAAVVYVNRWVTLEGLSGLFGAAS